MENTELEVRDYHVTLTAQMFHLSFKPSCVSLDINITYNFAGESSLFTNSHPAVRNITSFIRSLGPFGGTYWLTNLRYVAMLPKEDDTDSALVVTHFDYTPNMLLTLKQGNIILSLLFGCT